MVTRGVYPRPAGVTHLSAGTYGEFADFRNVVNVIEHVCLGSGEKGKALLGVKGEWTRNISHIKIDGAMMTFDDISLTQNSEQGKSRS